MNKHNSMKQRALLLTVFCGGIMVSSCGNSNKNEASDSDSATIMDMVETVASDHTAYITKDSIGAIYIGKPMVELADSVHLLYSSKENGASPDAVTVTFSNEDGEQFIAYDFGEGNIDVLNVIGTDIKVNAPAGEFGLGDSFSRVLELPGVTAEWSGYDDSGMWYWTWEGLWFAPSQDRLSPKLSRLLYHSATEPEASDFSEENTVGFIGTGLPF